MPVPAADDDSDEEWVLVVAVAVVAIVFALDLLRSADLIGEADWLAACWALLLTIMAAACGPPTRSFSLLLVTTVILVLWVFYRYRLEVVYELAFSGSLVGFVERKRDRICFKVLGSFEVA